MTVGGKERNVKRLEVRIFGRGPKYPRDNLEYPARFAYDEVTAVDVGGGGVEVFEVDRPVVVMPKGNNLEVNGGRDARLIQEGTLMRGLVEIAAGQSVQVRPSHPESLIPDARLTHLTDRDRK